ncbi:MAG: hypothetical protein KDA91_13510 [Planctomycetaceae bacterium]|nr:hypothetical protein [Planctomycetaceae bacterium]
MFKRILNFSSLVTAILLNAGITRAHEGHGPVPDQGDSVIHYVASPYHAGTAVLICVVLLSIAVWIRKGFIQRLRKAEAKK